MASSKNYTEVLIGGKVFTLSGFESEDYLQKISNYLNHKIADCESVEGYNRQSAETRSTLLALNIADDYFKAKRQGAVLENDVQQKDKEMYDLYLNFDNIELVVQKVKNQKIETVKITINEKIEDAQEIIED